MRREDGFTLIEVLVSLALIALAATLMGQGLAGGRRLAAAIEHRTVAGESTEAAESTIRERFWRSYPATRFDATTPFVDFDGAPATATWLSAPAQNARPGALLRFRLRLAPDGRLMLGEATPNVREQDVVYTERALLTGVSAVELAYFGVQKPNPAPAWNGEWQQQGALPGAIRVRVAFERGDARVWPELIIHPGATIDTQCSIDPTTGRCRGRAA